MPVSAEGYCRLQESFSCFLRCPPGEHCPGQLTTGAAANMPEGGCSQSMMALHKKGAVVCERASKGVR